MMKQYLSFLTPQSKPFDPLALTKQTQNIVCQERSRKYTDFYCTGVYGGISTGYTVGCNLRCVFCWVNWSRDFPFRAGSFYSPEKVRDRLVGIARRRGVGKMRISGGEPTLCPDHILSVLDLLGQKNFLFILETNGILLGSNPELVSQLKRFKNIHIRVSLKAGTSEGFERRTGGKGEYYELPFRAIEYVKHSGISFHVAAMTDTRLMPRDERVNLVQKLRRIGYSDYLEEERCDPYASTLKRLEKAGLKLTL